MSASSAVIPTPTIGPIVSLQAHILRQQASFPEATGTLSWILSALSISSKIIAAKVRRARLENVLGAAGAQNVQGEQQQKLDIIANEVLLATLGGRDGVAMTGLRSAFAGGGSLAEGLGGHRPQDRILRGLGCWWCHTRISVTAFAS